MGAGVSWLVCETGVGYPPIPTNIQSVRKSRHLLATLRRSVHKPRDAYKRLILATSLLPPPPYCHRGSTAARPLSVPLSERPISVPLSEK